MTTNKVRSPILAGLVFVSLVMFSLPAFAVPSTAPELQTEQKVSRKQLFSHGRMVSDGDGSSFLNTHCVWSESAISTG